MADIRGKVSELYSLEQLSAGNTAVHSLHPAAKLPATLCYLICLMSFSRYALSALVPFVLYPIILMALGEIPFRMILKRAAAALPFCLFAGISNVIVDRAPLLSLGGLEVSGGVVSFAALLFRALLCVAAVLILVAVTPFQELTGQLRRMHVPWILTALFEMTYRYVGTLLEEASAMYTAYRLRSPNKGLEMKHMGSFVGQLLLRSFDRAERVYQAMKCRGYAGRDFQRERRPMAGKDWAYLLVVCASSLLFRFVNLPMLLGGFA